MASAQPKTVVIICPHCTTRYQVPGETIGAKGRQVQCAHCGKAWQAFAEKVVELPPAAPAAEPEVARAKAAAPAAETEDDRMFDADAEAELDAAFEAEQRKSAEAAAAEGSDAMMAEAERALADARAALAPAAPATPPPPQTPADKKREKAFSRRQEALTRQLPMARVRRTLRVVGVGTLALMLVGGVVLRTDLVRLFPDLAGVYEGVGLGVNVVGLDFRDVKTLLSRRSGSETLQVDARIYSVAPGKVNVPQVLVTLLNDIDQPLYQWTVAPLASSMQPGEIMEFSSQLTMPPAGASKVRLSFTNGGIRAEAMTAMEPAADQTAAGAAPAQNEGQ
jgi:predicted Zn finger-like uncharacterized protein